MGTDWSSFLSRDELLAGLPARRASTLLFAIESRTAHLVQRSRRSLATYLTERSGEAQERDFMDALAQGRDMVAKPSVQDLERYASRWAPLVPPDPGVRATLAHLLGERYHLLDTRTPGITSAIGLTDPTVGERFQALYDAPISSILAPSAPARERWRWLRAGVSDRLENLPPFWTAFALTLTETVGAGILALPIAFANVGPLAGIIALVVLGLVNIGTIAAMAEAVARNGEIRYGRSYFGRMVREYLGPAGSAIMTPVLFVLVTIILLSYFIGFSSTLADATGLRAEWWAAGLLLVLVYFVRRRNLGATVASALLVGATTISLIVIIALLALPHVKADNLRHAEVPFRDGRPFDASILELVFGVVLFAYFGHTSTAVCAPVVLERDPTGRSLIRGAVAALAAAAGLYVLWVVAVNGAVSPGVLATETGTALAPLTTLVGPGVHVAGGIFVILAMGMASIQQALGLSYQVREWLPTAGPMLPSDGVPVPAPWSRAGVGQAMAGPRWRGAMGMAPIVIIFLVVEWLFITGQESFAGLLGFIGAVVGPIVAGVFSMLMLVAARRKGDYAADGGWRFLGSRAVVWVVCALFLTSVVFHGLFAWDDLLRRGVALVVSAVVVGLIVAIRRDAYVPRAVIEVREEAGAPGDPVVNVVARGVPVPVEVGWSRAVNRSRGGPGGDRTMSLHLPALPVREVKVWAHRLDPEGVSEARPARVAFHRDDGHGDTAAVALSGHLIVPSDGTSARVEIILPSSGDSPRTVARPR